MNGLGQSGWGRHGRRGGDGRTGRPGGHGGRGLGLGSTTTTSLGMTGRLGDGGRTDGGDGNENDILLGTGRHGSTGG